MLYPYVHRLEDMFASLQSAKALGRDWKTEIATSSRKTPVLQKAFDDRTKVCVCQTTWSILSKSASCGATASSSTHLHSWHVRNLVYAGVG
jgi:hypothetical protein